MGDRSVNLDDLDPSRRNTRNVTLMAVERMKLPVLNTRTDLTELGEPVTEDLAGTKNRENAAFTISNTPVLGSLIVSHQGVDVARVSGSPASGEYSISGTTITMGLVPDSTDKLVAHYVKA